MEALLNLARLAGVTLSYEATDGRQIVAGGDILRRILSALNLPADTDEQIALATGRLHSRSRALQPVIVYKGKPIPFFLEHSTDPQPYSAEIQLEGDLVITPLQKLEQHPEAGGSTYYLHLLDPLPPGYHHLYLLPRELGRPGLKSLLIVAPAKAFDPVDLPAGSRALGLQLYALADRAATMGTFYDLLTLASAAREEGFRLLGLNPLHAPPWEGTDLLSPYSPSSRYYKNPYYLDPARLPEYAALPDSRKAEARADQARGPLDYRLIFQEKDRLLRSLFEIFYTEHLPAGSALATEFAEFRRTEGNLLRLQALYDALRVDFSARGQADWNQWPLSFQQPDLPAVQAYEKKETKKITFYCWLYWHAGRQFDQVARQLDQMGLGLYLDLAVGVPHLSFETWAFRDTFALKASTGAPPDPFAPGGQNWGLAPFHPHRLRDVAYAPFIEILRRNMLPGGVLRMDHFMQIMRLYWVVNPGAGEPGAYVSYPADELAAIIALESQRNKTLIIGEDLGTVPSELSRLMKDYHFLSWKVLYFEKDGDEFKDAGRYPESSLFSINTHDLPTLRGFLEQTDIDLRSRLNLLTPEQEQAARAERQADIRALLQRIGLNGDVPPVANDVLAAIRRWAADLPCRLIVESLHDLLSMKDQPNLPGTTREYPNWALPYRLPVSQIKL
ncbi:MAG: 4-alpha-glucanotransferase [Spirochaetales bacterium]|nr:4-alpha-glucanotransferase [Spirochaetales bacterium]